MSNKTVLISCFGKRGAAPAFALAMAEGFKESNNKVVCLITDEISNLPEWEKLKKDEIDVHYMSIGNQKTLLFKSIPFLLFGKKRIKKILKNQKFDISIQAFVHPWLTLINRWIKPVHFMAVIHDPQPHTGAKKLKMALLKKQYEIIPEIIVLTKAFIPIVAKEYKKNRKNIYYMRLGKFSSTYKNKPMIRNNLTHNNDSINFLFFGRIEKYKGIGVLIDAYKSLKGKYENISLTIAGNGDMSAYTNTLSTLSDVEIINRYILDQEIADLFSRENTVLVLPYIDATQSGVIPIAADFNMPVIATRTGGLVEQLDDGKIGLFVEPNSVNSLKSAMEVLITDDREFSKQVGLMSNYSKELEWSNITVHLINEINKRNQSRSKDNE